MLFSSALLYSQTLYGPRWFLPQKYFPKSEYGFKTAEELINISESYLNEECVICLNKLFEPKDTKIFTNNFENIAENENVQIFKDEKKTWFKNINAYVFNFHQKEINYKKYPFFVIECQHSFHSKCIVSWINKKQECPICRKKFKLD